MATRYGTRFDDTLHGDGGFDTIIGDADRLIDSQRGGIDTIYGGLGHDTLIGDARDLYKFARGGDDVLCGDNGSGGTADSRTRRDAVKTSVSPRPLGRREAET